MKKRLITSLFIVLATVLAIFSKLLPYDIGTYIFDIFILFIVIVAGFEMAKIMQASGRKVNNLLTTMYGVFNYAILLISLHLRAEFTFIVLYQLVGVAVYFVITLITELVKDSKQPFSQHLATSANTMLACMYPSFWFCLMLNINHVDLYAGQFMSLILIILVVAVTQLTDTLAYLVGSRIKGPKLAPKISPNKTISGAIGGLLGGIAGAMILFAIAINIPALNAVLSLHGLAWWHFLLIGFFGSVIGQIGDLFESKLKRKANIKDSGNIFPGHGGMLDRIDAMIFVAIFVFVCLMIILL